MSTIRVKAFVALRTDDHVLLAEGYDTVKQKAFLRAPGGGVEFGESASDAATREIREELGIEITDVRQLGVLESRFVNEGLPGHEIVFVFEAPWPETRNPVDCVMGTESDGIEFKCRWVSLDELGSLNVVPDGFVELLS